MGYLYTARHIGGKVVYPLNPPLTLYFSLTLYLRSIYRNSAKFYQILPNSVNCVYFANKFFFQKLAYIGRSLVPRE